MAPTNNDSTRKNDGMAPEIQSARMNEERAFLTKLFESALKGNGAKVKEYVMDYSSQQDLPPSEVLAQFKDGRGRTALHFACQSTPVENNDDDDIVSDILDWLDNDAASELLRIKDKEGLTPLMVCAQNPDAKLAERRADVILKKGGSKLALARSKAGATALHYAAAAAMSRPALIHHLYQAGNVALEANSVQGGTPLHWAAAGEPPVNHVENMQALVDCGANVNAPNEQGLPPLVLAAAASNDSHGKFLVQAGADCSTVLPKGVTVFHIAADLNLVGTLAAMLETCVDAEDYCGRKNDNGETPLDLAAQEGHVGCVVLLLPEAETDAEAVRACIEEARAKKKDAPEVQTPKEPSKNPPTDEEDAMMLATQVASMTVLDDEKERALQLKAQGNDHFVKKELQKAVEFYTAAIEADPTDATFYANRSACYLMLGQSKDALRDAVVARQLRPDWPKACYRMALARFELGRYEDAALAAWEGLQQDQENEELQRLLQKCVNKGKMVHRESLAKREKKEEQVASP